MLLGVNIDHTATLREARQAYEPDIITAAVLAQLGGADSITCHLRQDRRHINESDIIALKAGINVPLNVEISTNKDIMDFILDIVPEKVCLVPENPEEVTTEGGLNILDEKVFKAVSKAVEQLKEKEIEVSLFVEPDNDLIDAASEIGADSVELNTAAYSECTTLEEIEEEYVRLEDAANHASLDNGLIVNAGHGLNYDNVEQITFIDTIVELNIGHSIVAHSVYRGMEQAVREMRRIIDRY